MLQAFSRIDISEFTDINIIKGVADVYADIKKNLHVPEYHVRKINIL